MIPAGTPAATWTMLLLALPLAGAGASFLLGRRCLPWLPLLVGAGVVVAAAMTVVELLNVGAWRYPVAGWRPPLGIVWRVDGLSAALLVTTAVICLAVAVHAAVAFHRAEGRLLGFWPILLILWTALNGLFLSADIFNLYVTLELISLSAVALVSLEGKPEALVAAMRYLIYAIFGSMSYLLGVALLYGAFGTLDLGMLGERMTAVPAAYLALALMSAGLFVKTALFPVHGWLPPAHAGAPAVGSALLSGLVVTAGVYLLVRLLQESFAGLLTGAAAQLFGWLGAAAVLWGSLLAVQQRRIKRLVAYSTVAQLGYLLLIVPLGSAGLAGGALLAVAHALAKSAMFLAAGLVLDALGHDRIDRLRGAAAALPLPFFTMALSGLTLTGLPPSGGFAAKWLLLEAAFARGQWWWAPVLLGGGLLAAAYVFRILARALGEGEPPELERPAVGLQWLSLALALVSVLIGLWPLPVVELLQVVL